MDTGINIGALKHLPYLKADNGIIVEVSDSFLDLISFPKEIILYKTISEISQLLFRNNTLECLELGQTERSYFIFTMDYQPREVSIAIRQEYANDKIYIFLEKPNSRIGSKFPLVRQLCIDYSIGIAVFSSYDLILLNANQTFLKFFSKPFNILDNIIGQRLESCESGSFSETLKASLYSCRNSGKTTQVNEYRNVEAAETEEYWDFMLIPVEECNCVKYIKVMTIECSSKVILRKRAEEQAKILKQQNNYIYNVFNTLELPIYLLSYPELKFTRVNNIANQKLLETISPGKGQMDQIKPGTQLFEVLPFLDSPKFRESIEEMVSSQKILFFRGSEITASGEKRYFKQIHQPLTNIAGEINEILTVRMDITKEIEQKNQLEKVLGMKDEFLSIVSHEMKTPLAVINAAIQSIEFAYWGQLPEKVQVNIKRIKQNSLRQLRLINNILDVTKASSEYLSLRNKNMDIVVVTNIIVKSVAVYAAQKGVSIEFSSSVKHKIIGVDDEKFERILLNLLSNAIKFTPAGKKIYIKLFFRDEKMHIAIKDEGIGIPKDKQNFIFERFGQVDSEYSRKNEGSGIGLSLVKMLVKAMGGEITVDSTEGEGSTFTTSLPIVKESGNLQLKDVKAIDDKHLSYAIDVEFSDIYL